MLEKEIKPPRPLTHDLFKNFCDRYEIIIKQVIIHKLVDGVFYSSLICERDKVEEVIDARTSDAIALALRFDAPIFTYKNILDKAGIFLKGESGSLTPTTAKEQAQVDDILSEKVEPEGADYKVMSLIELEDLLTQAVRNEDYEKAARIRDEISKRK